MLPDRRRSLIIWIVAIIFIALSVFGIYKLTSYIKSTQSEDTKGNDDYSDLYSYLGFIKDSDGVYKLYGISKNNQEEDLNVRTFYLPQDSLIRNDRLVIYSDAVNEVRYDSEGKEFYFYELDSYYKVKNTLKLSNDYMVSMYEGNLSYSAYGDSFEYVNKISTQVTDYIIKDNKVYYKNNTGVYVYDFDNEKSDNLMPLNSDDEVELLGVYNDYLFLYIKNKLYYYSLEDNTIHDTSEDISYESIYVDASENGFLFIYNNTLKEYVINKGTVTDLISLDEGVTISYSKYLGSNIYYMIIDEVNQLINVRTNKRTILDNTYVLLERMD